VDDVIIAIQSNQVRNLAQFQNRLADLDPDQTVTLAIIRDGVRRGLTVKLESAPDEVAKRRLRSINDRTIPQLPYRLRTLRSGMSRRTSYQHNSIGDTTEQREYDIRGVRIQLPPSAASTTRPHRSSGMGETIVKCEDKPVRSVADLLDVLRTRQPGDKVTVELYDRDSTTKKTELVITGGATQTTR